MPLQGGYGSDRSLSFKHPSAQMRAGGRSDKDNMQNTRSVGGLQNLRQGGSSELGGLGGALERGCGGLHRQEGGRGHPKITDIKQDASSQQNQQQPPQKTHTHTPAAWPAPAHMVGSHLARGDDLADGVEVAGGRLPLVPDTGVAICRRTAGGAGQAGCSAVQ